MPRTIRRYRVLTRRTCVSSGAGFTGISTALHLSERGYKVHVLGANRAGWGASGRNGGQIIGGISGEGKIARSLGSDGDRMMWEMRWAGQIMADAVAGTMERTDIFSAIRPTLIPGAHRFQKPLVSLGMMYFQLKDRF